MSLVPSKKGTAAKVDNTSRKTWDKDEFRKKAQEKEKARSELSKEEKFSIRNQKRIERDPLKQGLIVERSELKQRDTSLDLASRIGKTQVVSSTAPISQQAGFYCNICDCVLKDSMAYLDHINGKWHNRALGMSMKVERSTVEQVKRKLEEVKAKKQASSSNEDYLPDGVDRRILEAQEAEEREEEEKREAKRLKRQMEKEAKAKDEQEEEAEGADEEMMALMGFGGFK